MDGKFVIEFDDCSEEEGAVEVRQDEHTQSVVLRVGDNETVIATADRDQWGCFIGIGDVGVAQEDGTRSALDAVIKGLQKLREMNEFETKDTEIVGV